MNDLQIARMRVLVEEMNEILEGVIPEEPTTPDETALTGTIGRPEFKTPKDIPLWTAGLKTGDNGSTQWVNLVAWRDLAEQAQYFRSGGRITVRGTPKTEEYVNGDGVVKTKTTFLVSSFDV